jgi:hypothetical protein
MNSDKRLTWLIESGVYGQEIEPLVREVRWRGMNAELIPHRELTKGPPPAIGGRTLGPGDPAIGYGTFPFAR